MRIPGSNKQTHWKLGTKHSDLGSWTIQNWDRDKQLINDLDIFFLRVRSHQKWWEYVMYGSHCNHLHIFIQTFPVCELQWLSQNRDRLVWQIPSDCVYHWFIWRYHPKIGDYGLCNHLHSGIGETTKLPLNDACSWGRAFSENRSCFMDMPYRLLSLLWVFACETLCEMIVVWILAQTLLSLHSPDSPDSMP